MPVAFTAPRLRVFVRSLRVLTLLGVCTNISSADTLRMPNGERLTGTVVSTSDETIVFRSDSFGLLTLPRAPGLVIETGPAVSTAPIPAPAAAAATPPATPRDGPPDPPPGLVQKALGLSDKWSAEVEMGLMFLHSEFNMDSYSFETTFGYNSPPHEAGLFASYYYQKLDDTVVSENTQVAGRYFYHAPGRWMLISQADWERDRINFVENRSNLIAIPAYKFIDREDLRLLMGVGPSYRFETRLVPAGPGPLLSVDHDSFRLALYQVFNYKITPALTLRETFLLQSDAEDTGNTSIRFVTSLRRMITAHLSINLEFEYNRDENIDFEDQSVRTLNLMTGYSF